jgi:hypothetical protein
MAVLKQHLAPGMPTSVYDQVAAAATPSQSRAAGFVAHYAIVENGGIKVIEIRDSIAQHDAWGLWPNCRPVHDICCAT